MAIDERCIEHTTVSKIKVEDQGKSAVILNHARVAHLRIQVDGCIITDGRRADWVVERGADAVVIELKGRNVEHGADQAVATAEMWIDAEQRVSRICGLIVAAQYPKSASAIQLRQQKFARKFAGPLHVVNRNAEFCFEHLLSFRGPFRA